MASLCFADLILAHHMIEVPPVEVTDPETGVTEFVPQPDRPCTPEDLPEVRDAIGYDLAVEHLGITRCEAAFRRFTFDRTGEAAEADPRAVEFWQNLDAVQIARRGNQADSLPFAEQAAIRQRAFDAMGEALASDYMRACCRVHDDVDSEAGFNLGVLLLATIAP